MYYVGRVGPNIVSAIRNNEVAAIRNVLLYYVNGVPIGTRALVVALARCPLLGMSVKRGSTVYCIEILTYQLLGSQLRIALSTKNSRSPSIAR